MAQRVLVQLVDDIDGSELEEGGGTTVQFALDGTSYEIDLSEKNAKKLRKALEPYVEAGRKVGGRSRRTTATGGKRSKEELANIRSWWREQGNEIGDRGRIPQNVMDAYHAAH